jgi:alpha-methylacyl-CoA racemase
MPSSGAPIPAACRIVFAWRWGKKLEPLSGLLVLDLTRLLPGPYCAWLLRSWGARTVKVEDPVGGDYLREMQPVWFAHLNAGAESVAIDLKHPDGREAFLKLAAWADVVLEGFRPGVLDRLGLGYEALQAVNPRLVLTSVSGYAADSGLSQRAGHDLGYLARSGILSLMSEIPPIQLADLGGGLMAAAGTLAAVVAAKTTGRGAHVEASLADAVAGLGTLLAAEARAGAEPTRERMVLGGALGCYSIYTTADGGRVTLAALEGKFWRHFCLAVGRADWLDRHLDPDLKPELEELFRSRPLAWWAELAEAGDLCLEPVRSVAEAAGQPARAPVAFGGRRRTASGEAPERGADTRRLLEQAGVSHQEIAVLAASGAIPPG